MGVITSGRTSRRPNKRGRAVINSEKKSCPGECLASHTRGAGRCAEARLRFVITCTPSCEPVTRSTRRHNVPASREGKMFYTPVCTSSTYKANQVYAGGPVLVVGQTSTSTRRQCSGRVTLPIRSIKSVPGDRKRLVDFFL